MDFIHAKGKRVYLGNNEILLKGYGVGGWFLPEGYMWKLYNKCDRPRKMERLITDLCGKEYAGSFWDKYLNSYITEKDVRYMAEQNMNSVRLPLNARFLLDENDEFVLKTIGKVDEFISWCKKYGIFVVIDMHGAFGGQTGTNIDDCENDMPELFIEKENQDRLVRLWGMIAARYKDETIIAGYDLLNEPLPKWFSEYNHLVLPLYERITKEIRKFDQHHMIILEGVHWATDWSIFEPLKTNMFDQNIMLQFHRYRRATDKESLSVYLEFRDSLNLPIYMGEGGENNNDWYTGVFPLYERLNISWNFWTYKKMDIHNSPMSFHRPKNWEHVIEYLDGVRTTISRDEAIEIFDDFLYQINHPYINQPVTNALMRRVPFTLPAEYFDEYEVHSARQEGAIFRMSDNVSILFVNGKKNAVPDFDIFKGIPTPEDEKVYILLGKNEFVSYGFTVCEEANISVKILCKTNHNCTIKCVLGGHVHTVPVSNHSWETITTIFDKIQLSGKQKLKISIDDGELCLQTLFFEVY